MSHKTLQALGVLSVVFSSIALVAAISEPAHSGSRKANTIKPAFQKGGNFVGVGTSIYYCQLSQGADRKLKPSCRLVKRTN